MMRAGRIGRWFVVWACLLAGVSPAVAGETVRKLPIGEVFEKGLAAPNVRLAEDAKGIILYDRVLYEDDGPGIGASAPWLGEEDRSPEQQVGGDIKFKKILVVDRPEALEGHFCIKSGLKVTVNGKPVSEEPTSGSYPKFPPNLLQKGENEIILEAPAGQTVWIKAAQRKHILQNAPERASLPPRSFRSIDGGKTWQPFDGEFFVRIQLKQYVPKGEMISPVIDLAPEAGGILQSPVAVTQVGLKTEQDTPEGTSIAYLVRTGTSPAYEKELWTDWQSAAAKIPAGHRYLQWKALLSTGNATKSPVLKGVTVTATVQQDAAPAWATALQVTTLENPEFRYTSMPFQYEDPNHPKMKALREKYKLDEVVAPGKTELEKLVLLRNWVSKQWKYKPPEGHYPAWDAEEILTLKYGFCVQYAIVYVQCATALGYQTRFYFGNNYKTGHEVAEVWSNEYRKWCYMDPNRNIHLLNLKTKAPMSALEVRDLILETYYDNKVARADNYPKELKTSDKIATLSGTQIEPGPIDPKRVKSEAGGKDGQWYVPPGRWMALRYVDRNNFLSQRFPEPRTEGAGDWDYPDFWMWDDGHTLSQYRYRHNTARRSDLDWTINQVRFDAAYAAKPDTLAVQMCTVTPYFETFLVNVDGQGWTKAARTFPWTLHPGKNRLEMRAQNTSGIQGPVSSMEVEKR